jgi:hypothetical protein
MSAMPMAFLLAGTVVSALGLWLLRAFYKRAAERGETRDAPWRQLLEYMLAFALLFVGALFAVLGAFMLL